jgi:hypothetical protein
MDKKDNKARRSNKTRICPKCGKTLAARGLHAHLRLAHELRISESKLAKSDSNTMFNHIISEIELLKKRIEYLIEEPFLSEEDKRDHFMSIYGAALKKAIETGNINEEKRIDKMYSARFPYVNKNKKQS